MYDCNTLVIDDDKVMLELIQSMLKNVISGDVYIFSNSSEALHYIKSDDIHKVSLVICDWMMPDVSGLNILQALRETKPNCPFLMVTANATKQLVVDAMQLGATDFILKPFTPDNLITQVERLIRDADID